MILHITVQKDAILLDLAVYSVMLKLNSKPNCSTFSTFIDGLCKSERTQDALKLFDEMSERGVLPNKITYTIIYQGYVRLKELMMHIGCLL
ncbi:hypothetical protein P3S68_026372 [Capsicum galapagoense]